MHAVSMSDQVELIYGAYDIHQKRNPQGALELLNMIHNTSPSPAPPSGHRTRRCNESRHKFELPLLFNTGILDFTKDNALIFGGRCVIIVDNVFPLRYRSALLSHNLPATATSGPIRKAL